MYKKQIGHTGETNNNNKKRVQDGRQEYQSLVVEITKENRSINRSRKQVYVSIREVTKSTEENE